MIVWLVDCSICVIDCLVVLMVARLIDWLVFVWLVVLYKDELFVTCVATRLVDCLVCDLVGWLVNGLLLRSLDRYVLIDGCFVCLYARLND